MATSGTSAPGLTLGPFRLGPILGTGGMGDVYAATHIRSGEPVAVKVLRAHAQGIDDLSGSLFRNEIEAHARLLHPSVIAILDTGHVDEDTAAHSARLHPGAPWIGMERADAGALYDVMHSLDWPRIRRLLLSLLDALAHAHARGVIHRDIKPGNVLLCSESSARPGLKLTDFGIAHAVARASGQGNREAALGTPQYMAPEQFEGRWRDYGPWTDLYSLGVVAWELVAHRRPFIGTLDPGGIETPLSLALAHLEAEPPALDPRIAVPTDLEPWLRRLLAKGTHDRFPCAADAAWALESLPDPVERATAPLLIVSEWENTAVTAQWAQAELLSSQHTLAPPRSSATSTIPPMPEHWHRGDGDLPWTLQDAGMNLYGLRPVRFVGRGEERETIWEKLRWVRQEGRARTLVVRGPAGIGKTRLMTWMAQRAQEVGAATVLRAGHGPTAGGDGLRGMVVNLLRCEGLSRANIQARARFFLDTLGVRDPYEWRALTELLSPAAETGFDANHTISAAQQRYAVIGRLLVALGRHRPVIMILDDVHWGLDAINFAAWMMSAQTFFPTPCLFLLAAEDDLPEDIPESAALRGLLNLDGAAAMDLRPLEGMERTELVSELLHLEGELAQAVEARTAGHPLFAVQLVGDWVQRGLLVAGERGFELSLDRVDLPEDIYAMWTDAMTLLVGDTDEARAALEIAAVLGVEVSEAEWLFACDDAGVAAAEDALERLVERGLARRREGGWTFVTAMVRDWLIREASGAGRLAGHHALCAQMLERLYAHAPEGVAERIADHALRAGRVEISVAPLLRAATWRAARSESAAARALLDRREQVLAELGVADADPRVCVGHILRASIDIEAGAVRDARETARRAVDAARGHGGALLARALMALGRACFRGGDHRDAAALYQEAMELSEAAGDRPALAECLRHLGHVAHLRKETDAEEAYYEEALSICTDLEDPLGMGQCFKALGVLFRQRGEMDRARVMYQEALSHLEAAGSLIELARLHNGLGEIGRFEGDLDAAQASYHRALELHEHCGSAESVVARLNLGLVQLSRGRFPEARSVLAAGLETLEALGMVNLLPYVHAGLLPCAAAAGDFSSWATHLAGADTEVKDTDIASCAEQAGDLLRESDPLRARGAYELAMVQWRAMNRTDRVSAVERIIAAL